MKRLTLSLLVLSIVATAAVPAVASAAKAGSIALPKREAEALFQLRHPRGLNRFVRAVSDPASPRYRRYATVEQLVARFGAKPQARRRVMRWLAARGLHGTVLGTGDYVLARVPAGLAARLLPARAAASAAGGEAGARVPPALRGAVARVSLLDPAASAAISGPAEPAAALSASASKHKRPFFSILPHTGTASGCAAGSSGGVEPGFEPFTPNQYLRAYGFSAMHAKGLEGQGVVVATVEGGGFKHSDLEGFARCFGLRVPPIKVVPVASGKPLPGEDEPTLDLSMLVAGAPKLKKIYAYEGGESTTNIVETAAAALGSPGHRPDVISISYGYCESYLSGTLSIRNAIDNVFAVAAGAGISVLASAGDQGSSGCRAFSTEGEETALTTPAVSMPASSAYATAVGGTNLELSPKNRIKKQIVWNDWPIQPSGGGGGSSLLYPRTPWWQSGIHSYQLGRKVPDIAALADVYPGYAIYCTAAECEPKQDAVFGWESIGGTSAAAPLMAAGVALADQYAARHRQPPLGFVNPLLYELGANAKTRNGAFYDVTEGNNDIGRALPPAVGGGSPLGCCSARPGYDWASGWGSLKIPGFAKLAAAAAG